MKKSKYAGLLLLPLAVSSYNACADDDTFDDRFYVAPMFSSVVAPSNRHVDNGYGGGLAIGKSLMPHLGIEILGDYLAYKGGTAVTPATASGCGLLGLSACPAQPVHTATQRIYGGGLGANLYLSPTNTGLFLHADAQAGNRFSYNGGIGGDFAVTESGIGLRLEALYHREAKETGEPMIRIGVRVPFGSLEHPQPPPPDAPVTVVPVDDGSTLPAAGPETAPVAATDGVAGTDAAAQPAPASDAAPQEAPAATAPDAATAAAMADTSGAAQDAPVTTEEPKAPKAKKAKRKKHKVKAASAPAAIAPEASPAVDTPATEASSPEPSTSAVSQPEPAPAPSQPAAAAPAPQASAPSSTTQSTGDAASQSSDDTAVKVPETPYVPEQPPSAQ